ncbi:hypothetical protein D923_02033 [Enterococcus faecalis 06-MB-S-04]|nr:hypothetical protein D923_02033 [Enterococcus faecalis 06-MB-S-04]
MTFPMIPIIPRQKSTFSSEKCLIIKRICHFATDSQPNSLIFINKSSKY